MWIARRVAHPNSCIPVSAKTNTIRNTRKTKLVSAVTLYTRDVCGGLRPIDGGESACRSHKCGSGAGLD